MWRIRIVCWLIEYFSLYHCFRPIDCRTTIHAGLVWGTLHYFFFFCSGKLTRESTHVLLIYIPDVVFNGKFINTLILASRFSFQFDYCYLLVMMHPPLFHWQQSLAESYYCYFIVVRFQLPEAVYCCCQAIPQLLNVLDHCFTNIEELESLLLEPDLSWALLLG